MSARDRFKCILKLTGIWGLYCWSVYAFRNRRVLMASFGKTTILFEYKGARVRFSVEDLYSRKFFSDFCQSGKIYEKDSLDVLLTMTKDGDTVFDIGANIGYYACILGVYFPNSTVHAFEMSERNSEILRRNVQLNRLNNVVVHNVAIAERSKTGHYVRNYLGSAVVGLIEDHLGGLSADIADIRTISLDDFCDQNRLLPRIVKMDIEGGEVNAIRGMMRVLSKVDVILFVEVHTKKHDRQPTNVGELLESIGYVYEPVRTSSRANTMLVARKRS